MRGGVNPLKDRLKLDNCVTRAMLEVMKLVASLATVTCATGRHPTPSCKKSSPWRVKRAVGKVAPWPHRRYG